jgi:dTDP-4-amino-4,6-dideoxygalactose transaminase
MITEDDIDEVVQTLRSGWIGTGPRAAAFAEALSEYVGAPHCLPVNSCTAGLHLALIAAGVGPGDEVITTSMTFAASANVIVHCGATPVFVDCDVRTMNIDPAAVTAAITSRTKAVVSVDMAGRPCDYDALSSITRNHGLVLIEDAAHALGAEFRGQRVGALADFTAFSFYVTKNLVTGEGGAIFARDPDHAATMAKYSLHGLSHDAWRRYSDAGFRHYLVSVPGFKYNMTDIQAALGLSQLARFDAMQERRSKVWARYDQELRDLPLSLPPEPPAHIVHARHLYTPLLELEHLQVDRDAVQAALHAEGIGTGIHFLALHLHPYYRDRFGYERGAFPAAEHISDRTISLPLGANVTDDDVDDVVEALVKVLTRYQR